MKILPIKDRDDCLRVETESGNLVGFIHDFYGEDIHFDMRHYYVIGLVGMEQAHTAMKQLAERRGIKIPDAPSPSVRGEVA
jgi:hypothetical protein